MDQTRRMFSLLALTGLGSACSLGPAAREVVQEGRDFRAPRTVPTEAFPAVPPYPTWTDSDGGYRLYPGDELDFASLGDPGLNRSLIVAPDGRIHPPLVGPVMAADRTLGEVVEGLQTLYARELRNPRVFLTPKSFASQKYFVGGEVERPGIYDLVGEIDPLQGILMAGGFKTSALRQEVAVLRRGAGGQPFIRMFDLRNVWAQPDGFAGLPRLRRFDVVWVPRSRISEVGLFTQQFVREALPITIGFSYNLGNRF
jgi:protein involved in polysaccharide export with SLBB domain